MECDLFWGYESPPEPTLRNSFTSKCQHKYEEIWAAPKDKPFLISFETRFIMVAMYKRFQRVFVGYIVTRDMFAAMVRSSFTTAPAEFMN